MNLKSVLCAATLIAAAGVANAFPSYTIYPAQETVLSTSQLLGNIQFTFSGANSIEISDSAAPFLENQDGNEIFSTNIRDFSAMQPGTVAFFFDYSEVKSNGEWSVVIPAGTLSVNGEENPELTASWTLDDPDLGIGEYPQISLVSIVPAEGSKLAVWGGSLSNVYIETSDDKAVNYIGWSLVDITNGGEEFVTQGSENRIDYNRYGNNDDNWTDRLSFSIGGETKLVENHTYRLNLRFCGIGYNPKTNQYPNPEQIEQSTELVTSVIYEGATPPQEYAEAKYLEVTPDPETHTITDANNAYFEITYSAPAIPTQFTYSQGEGRSAVAGEWEPSEGVEVDEKGLATKWTFKFFPNVVAANTGTLISNVISTDGDGLYVRGNGNYDFDNIRYQMVWLCNAGAPTLVAVSPEEKATVESLSSITISNAINSKAYPMSVSGVVYTYPEIRNKQGALVRTLNSLSLSNDGTQVTWSFDPITESGSYVLMIPYQYFAFGAEAQGFLSNATYFEYYVENNQQNVVSADLLPSVVSPESGATIDCLGTVTLTFDNVTNIHLEGGQSARLYKVVDGQEVYVEDAEPFDNPDSDWFNPTIYDFYFTKTYENGDYKIVVPEGMFFDNRYAESDGESGSLNPEFSLYYTVDAPNVADFSIEVESISPEADSTLEKLSTVTLTFPETVFVYQEGQNFAVNFASAILYKVTEEGDEEIQTVVPFDNPGSNYINPTIYDLNFAEVAEDGQYKVMVPQGLFGNLEYLETQGHGGKANKEISICYVVGSSVGVEAIFNGANSIDVYDVNGMEVLKNANIDAAKTLKSGIYVINGKKVIIRR